MTPWYVPCLATLGAVLLVVSLWQRRTVWRVLALLLVVLLAGAEWLILLSRGAGVHRAGRGGPAVSGVHDGAGRR